LESRIRIFCLRLRNPGRKCRNVKAQAELEFLQSKTRKHQNGNSGRPSHTQFQTNQLHEFSSITHKLYLTDNIFQPRTATKIVSAANNKWTERAVLLSSKKFNCAFVTDCFKHYEIHTELYTNQWSKDIGSVSLNNEILRGKKIKYRCVYWKLVGAYGGLTHSALSRCSRLPTVVETVQKCIDRRGEDKVLMNEWTGVWNQRSMDARMTWLWCQDVYDRILFAVELILMRKEERHWET